MVTKETSASREPSPSSSSSLTILTAADVDAVLESLSPESAISSQSAVFRAFSASSLAVPQTTEPIQVPQRIVLTSEENSILFMPSRVKSAGGTATKIVSVPRNGGQGGLPASTIIMDEVSGKVKAMINARKLTSIRNAAGSSLFLKLLPPTRPPKNLVLFGSGGQSLSHATFVLKMHPTIDTCTVVIRRQTDRAEQFASHLRTAFPNVQISTAVCSSPHSSTPSDSDTQGPNLSQIVHNANIIVSATPSTEALFNSVDVTSGTHIILIGSYRPDMREVEDHLIQRAGLVVVDSRKACLHEATELISTGVGEDGVVELGEILADEEILVKKIRESGDVVVFKSVGLGIQDVAIADLVLREATAKGLGTVIPNYD